MENALRRIEVQLKKAGLNANYERILEDTNRKNREITKLITGKSEILNYFINEKPEEFEVIDYYKKSINLLIEEYNENIEIITNLNILISPLQYI